VEFAGVGRRRRRSAGLHAGGDGWLYALDAETGEHLWKFDLNPKDSKWELGGRGTRNYIIATPVFYQNSVIWRWGRIRSMAKGSATSTGSTLPNAATSVR
jgi:hypothetical protein